MDQTKGFLVSDALAKFTFPSHFRNMTNQNIFKTLPLLVAFLTTSLLSSGQAKYDKAFKKAEDAWELGDYKNALSLLEGVKQKVDKKYGKENRYTDQYLMSRAKYSLSAGQNLDFETNIAQALNHAAGQPAMGPETYGSILINAGELYNFQGSAIKSKELLEHAEKTLKSTGSYKDDHRVRLDLNLAECLTQMGYCTEAIKILKSGGTFFSNRNNKIESYVDDRGERKTRKLEEPELKKRAKEYSRWLTSLANAYRRKGEVLQADSAFEVAGTWIQKNVGSNSLEYAKNQIMFATMLVENGLSADSQFPKHAGFESAVNHIIERYKPTHELAIEGKIQELRWLVYQGNNGRFGQMAADLQKLIESNFAKGSMHFIKLKVVEFEARVAARETSNLASEAIVLMASTPNLPRTHKMSAQIYQFLFDLSINQKNFRGAQEYIRKVADIREGILGTNAPETHLAKLSYANYLIDYSNNLQEALKIYNKSYDSIVAPEIGPWQKDHLNILNHLSSLYEITDNFEGASSMLERAKDVARSKYKSNDPIYGQEMIIMANLRMRIGQYEEAETEIRDALEILDKHRKDPIWKVAYINALEAQAKLFGLRGLLSEAEETLDRATNIIRKSEGENLIFDPLATAREMASLYIQLGRYNQTQELLDKLIAEYERLYGPSTARLIEPLVNRGYLLLAKGEYSDADKAAQRAYQISLKVFGDKSTKTAPSQRLLSDLYLTLGDYVRAEDFILKTIASQEEQFGRKHLEVAKSLSQLGIIRYAKGDQVRQIEKPLVESRNIISQVLGTDNPPYAEVLKNTALLSIAQKKYPEALSFLSQAEAIWSKKTGSKNSVLAAGIYGLSGDVYYYIKNYIKAEDFYNKGKKIYEDNFSKTHPEYVKLVSKLSRIYYMTGDYKKSKKFIEEALDNYELYIKQFFPALSEREKAKYWNTIRGDFEFYNTLAFTQSDDFKDLTGRVYNYQLLTKALLLSSSIKIKERIAKSSDEELKKTYNLWVQKKEMLTQSLSMSAAQLSENEVSPAVLAAEVERLEKELSVKSEIFGASFEQKRITYLDIQKSLKRDDAAIEIIRYRHFNHTFTDSIIYVGLMLKPESTKPEVINFPEGVRLETSHFRRYRNSITQLLQDMNSYKVYWSPIRQKIGESIANVYLSPDGVFNLINLETLPNPIVPDKYILDEINVVLVSNTRDLYIRKAQAKTASRNNSATVFGNPKFYVQDNADKVWPELPYTEREVSELRALLSTQGWQASQFTGIQATEEAVKSISNPKIFHVATHGFYSPAVQKNLDDEMTATENDLADNPLLKSGLLLKGAGDVLLGGAYNFNSESGVLTAYEAMNLNLDQTDLVVLSACETGLGEVTNGEGVYGLQRAFLVAGAKVLIMSMFKVDDEATQKLILNFYNNWLSSGNMRQSFASAKLDLRKEYPEPLYWGSFMMIGME